MMYVVKILFRYKYYALVYGLQRLCSSDVMFPPHLGHHVLLRLLQYYNYV